jgi:hypothetical protein
MQANLKEGNFWSFFWWNLLWDTVFGFGIGIIFGGVVAAISVSQITSQIALGNIGGFTNALSSFTSPGLLVIFQIAILIATLLSALVTFKFYNKRNFTTEKSIKSIMIGLAIASAIGVLLLAAGDIIGHSNKVASIATTKQFVYMIDEATPEELRRFAQMNDLEYDEKIFTKDNILQILNAVADNTEKSISIENYSIEYGGYVLTTGLFLIYVKKKIDTLKTQEEK